MTAAVSVNVTQGGVNVVAFTSTGASSTDITQAGFNAVVRANTDVRVTQSGWNVVVAESSAVPQSKVWTTTIDGHDLVFYQLPTETLVYDFAVGKWYVWGSGTSALWKAQIGTNWNANIGTILNSLDNVNGQNIIPTIVGDSTNGVLWFLDPDKTDDDNNTDGTTTVTYQRLAHGLIPLHGHARVPCYGVQVTGSLSKVTDATTQTVTLSTSDDAGASYDSQGAQTLVSTQLQARLEWRSLGSMTPPGRLFRVEDYGGLYRIDGLDMTDGSAASATR